ncbi:cysteine desulfurase family protein [Clostridium estertheticum]|uniref:cysteine desulfurase family protein n=1 Tax=Clostridium estertheticum TaxID=238834 RepID=UPI001C7D1D94|nr:cysteine desulfurase family protein [Clostridium estertheticum]MBX4263945.1 cysteine desulfurase [Clostridium estertheticum]WLC87061.1 cysteine desulfurase [Clostridium estertheticum]
MEIYLDNSATTKPYEEVIETLGSTMRNYYGNPSSAHSLGFKAEQKLREMRTDISKSINASSEEIIFTSGGSESNNFLIKGFAKQSQNKLNADIITTKIEHPSILNTFKALEDSGIKVDYIDVDDSGRIDIDALIESITKDTQVVSVMHVNNEIGVVQDIELIGKLIKEKSSRAKFHVDAVQSYGKIPIDVQKGKIDLLSTSAHKIHGPRGVGFAYIKKGLIPTSLINGGGQEKNLRSGTENLAGIAGFDEAAQIVFKNQHENFNKVLGVKKYFIEKLKEVDGIIINSPLEPYFTPYILSVTFKGAKGEVLLHALEQKGIYVSTGSACSAKSHKSSEILKAIGRTDVEQVGTIRFSFSEYNNKDEVDYVIIELNKSLKFLRKMNKR